MQGRGNLPRELVYKYRSANLFSQGGFAHQVFVQFLPLTKTPTKRKMTITVSPQALFDLVQTILPKAAFFLDYDETLIPTPTRENPEKPLDNDVLFCIVSIWRGLDCALAIVTGRDIEGVDQYTKGFVFGVAGNQGRVQRYVSPVRRMEVRQMPDVSAAREAVTDVIRSYRDMKLFSKDGGAFGVEYHAVPEELRERAMHELLEAIKTHIDGREDVQRFDFEEAYDVTDTANTKGKSIERYMKDPPYKDRIPIVAGNAANDEPGFLYANDNYPEAITICIGEEKANAKHRLDSVSDMHEFFEFCADYFKKGPKSSQPGAPNRGGLGRSNLGMVLGAPPAMINPQGVGIISSTLPCSFIDRRSRTYPFCGITHACQLAFVVLSPY